MPPKRRLHPNTVPVTVGPAASDNPHHPMRGVGAAGRRAGRVNVLAAAARRVLCGARPTAAYVPPPTKPAASEQIAGMKAEEVTTSLGISRTTLWRLRREGKLEAKRRNGRLFFDRADVEEYRKRSKSGSPNVEEAA